MHRAHDYRFLIKRWRAAARAAGGRLQRLVQDGDTELFYFRSKAIREDGGIYLSAGIHGDEPAGTEALIEWAERRPEELASLPVLIFPCLNPWGLVNNCRYNERGLDLNRSFHMDELPLVQEWKRVIGPYRFHVALNLHEDYDGQGLYLYEVQRAAPHWGEELLDVARPIIPIEGRSTVDGFRSRSGLIRRRMDMRRFGKIGYPEAIWLHMHHSLRTFTLETPSEFALQQRVDAQIAIIDTCVQRALAER